MLIYRSGRLLSSRPMALAGAGLVMALVGGVLATAAPAFATERQAESSPVGAGNVAEPWLRFRLGDLQTLAANLDTGGVVFETGIAEVIWDSAVNDLALTPRLGLGWTWGAPSVQARNQAPETVYVPRRGVFDADPASPSGLAGYPSDDVVYSKQSGTLPARDGVVPARNYVATLTYPRLGRIDYLDSNGNTITTVEPSGRRTDRDFIDAAGSGRIKDLRALIEPNGARSTVVYEGYGDDSPRIIRPDGGLSALLTNGSVWRIFSSNAANTDRLSTSIQRANGAQSPLSYLSTDDSRTGRRTDVTFLEWDDAGTVRQITHNDRIIFQR